MKKDENFITDEERQTQDMSAVADYDGSKSNRAKVVEYEGDDYVDRPVKDNSIEGRMSNLWYHYKWQLIFIPLIAICVIAGIVQMVNKEKYDVSVMYAGPSVISGDNYTALSDNLGEILSEDIDGDGNKNVYLYALNYYSEAQIAAQKELYSMQGIHDVTFDAQANMNVYKQFNDMVFVGEAGVMFLDVSLFEQVRDAGGLVTVESALGKKHPAAVDEYGIRLGDTAFYMFFKSVQHMSPDTILCLRGPSTVGGVFDSKEETQENFENNKKLFCDIMSFTLPEGFVAP